MESPLRWVVVVLWHSLPIWSAINRWPYATLAMIGVVALPYIKVRKLEQNVAQLESDNVVNTPLREEIDSLRLAISRWHYLTWPRRT